MHFLLGQDICDPEDRRERFDYSRPCRREAAICRDRIMIKIQTARRKLTMFKHSTGIAPHQYVLEQRIDRAKTLLSETALSLTEIAYRLGFASQSHFTAVCGGVAHLRLQNWRVRSTKAFITGSAARSALQARAISHAASGIESSLKRTPGGLRSAAELGASATPMPALTSMSIVKSSFVS